MRHSQAWFRRSVLLRDPNGNFAILSGSVAAVLSLSVGFAVNISQLYNANEPAEAVDAAVTSTARDLTTGKITEGCRAWWRRSSTPMASRQSCRPADRAGQPGHRPLAKTVEAKAHVDVPLFFPIFRVTRPSAWPAAAALYSDKTIEVAMMLDVTGSMKKSGRIDKIGDLKIAAENAVRRCSAAGSKEPARARGHRALCRGGQHRRSWRMPCSSKRRAAQTCRR